MAKKSPYNCGLDAAVDVVGGKWKPLLLWKLSVGPCRFGELRREFPAISEKMLIQQLRAMEGDGLVHRELYYQVPPRSSTRSPSSGESLNDALKPLGDWGEHHMERIVAARRGHT